MEIKIGSYNRSYVIEMVNEAGLTVQYKTNNTKSSEQFPNLIRKL